MATAVERLRKMPTPFFNCPKCHKEFEPFLRGLVKRGERWFWIGPRRDYCALICRSCKKIVGWETPPRACLSFEQITKITNEYWNPKIVDRIYNSDNLLLKRMLEDKTERQLAQSFRKCLANTIYPEMEGGG